MSPNDVNVAQQHIKTAEVQADLQDAAMNGHNLLMQAVNNAHTRSVEVVNFECFADDHRDSYHYMVKAYAHLVSVQQHLKRTEPESPLLESLTSAAEDLRRGMVLNSGSYAAHSSAVKICNEFKLNYGKVQPLYQEYMSKFKASEMPTFTASGSFTAAEGMASSLLVALRTKGEAMVPPPPKQMTPFKRNGGGGGSPHYNKPRQYVHSNKGPEDRDSKKQAR